MATKDDAGSFISKAMAIHGDRFSYHQVEYRSTKEKVRVVCHKHGPFLVTPNNHLRGRGCMQCRGDLARERYTKKFDVFLGQAQKRHGTAYQYVEASYKSALVPMQIVCPTHGSFLQRPDAHLRGAGCPKCADVRNGFAHRVDPKVFIAQAKERFGKRFDYSKTYYERMRLPVTIICRKHGPFESLPVDFLNSTNGCALCAGTGIKKTQEVFLAELQDIFGSRYDLSVTQYSGKRGKCWLNCSKHGLFEKTAQKLLKGQGCQKCAKEGSETKRLRNLRRRFAEGYDKRFYHFLERAQMRHGDKYDYSQVKFKTQHDAINIGCPAHGTFRQTPAVHLKSGCKRCATAELKGLYSERYFRRWPSEKRRRATLYYVRMTTKTEDFFKVGVTITDVRVRFGGYLSHGRGRLIVLRKRETTLHQAFIAEQEILAKHAKQFAYRPRIKNRSTRSLVGVSECFSKQIPEDVLQAYFFG